MQLAPGPLYLIRNLPYFVIPSTIVYACLTQAKEHHLSVLALPTWLTVLIAVLARPALFIFNRHYSRFADRRKAAANNAVVAPHVRRSAFSLLAQLARAAKGYPGLIILRFPCLNLTAMLLFFVADFMLDWTKEYGNIFQLRLLTDNRVRCVFTFPHSWSITNKELFLLPADNHGRTSSCQGRYPTFDDVV